MEAARLIGRRFVQLAVVLLLVTFFTFSLVRLLPGDPTETIIPFGTDQQRRAAREGPWHRQAVPPAVRELPRRATLKSEGTKRAARGRARPQVLDQPTGDRLHQAALPVSIQLVLYAQILALAIAIPLGVLAAYRNGTRTDRVIERWRSDLAIPEFVLAFVLSYFVGVRLGWLPTPGTPPDGSIRCSTRSRFPPLETSRNMILPVIGLAVGQVAIYMRLLRSDMIQTLQEDFITMAKAKGSPTGASCSATRCGRRASRCSRWPASTSGR